VLIETTNNEYIANTQNEEKLVSTLFLFFSVQNTKTCIVNRSQVACLNKRANINWLLQNC